MPRSEEANLWFESVYEAVQQIPYGQVTSYGHIARLLGRREYFLVFARAEHPGLGMLWSKVLLIGC